ncbi:putative malate dehydrogenase 1B isoform X6 [Rattus norvegicus]|uniref:putative malate dehydrogenase 1B isoform X6 n=1 Tax=Rattus norvegicus TaxID=10116 RepID=UPI0003D0E7C5|nr:putative malate dehydrogenase 1B isoform X6 [Rattus norvegicus]XP_038939581.1 putative malate dehydrogenase 1B isoform X6 [Rattus norvegicus]XP_038939582.1 putative malate dehydrogenase 1B isoform X6 [Rattus norvegicus]XP_038939583.1 putative malate dehydrogenase 1B isoform X6 [Rattus norvegicus]
MLRQNFWQTIYKRIFLTFGFLRSRNILTSGRLFPQEWLEDVCERNMWDHRISPIIWRELLDRGGKGLLLGGYNEFLEHAQLYYGITSSMTTELMMIIAQENMETHTEQELDKENLKDLISPLQVWITSAGSRVCCHLIPLLLSGEVFGMQAEISLTLFDQEQRRECLSNIVMETENLASPVLRTVSFCTTVKDAFLQAEVIIILDDSTDEEVYNMESCLRSRVPLCRLYGYLIEKNAHKSVKVIVGGKSFLNLKTTLLIQYAPSLASNIIAVALGLEGQAKAVLARKMKTIPSRIKDVIIWGNITGNNYVDLRKAKVYNYESAIRGPPGYYHSVLSLIFDREWITKEFVRTLKDLSSTGKQFGGILAAHSIATTLKYWYYGSPPGEIVSLGVMSEGQFGIPEGIVFSMPVKFENGTWVVLTDLEDLSLSEKIINRLTGDLIQEKLVASGDLLTFQPIEEDPKDNTPSPTGLNEEKEQAESDSPLSVTEPNQMQEAWLEEEGNKDSDVKHGDREKLQPEQT